MNNKGVVITLKNTNGQWLDNMIRKYKPCLLN